MKIKINKTTSPNPSTISTFHVFGLSLINTYAERQIEVVFMNLLITFSFEK